MTRFLLLLAFVCVLSVIALAQANAAWSDMEDEFMNSVIDEELYANDFDAEFVQLQDEIVQSESESVWATLVDRIDRHETSLIQQRIEGPPSGAGGSGASAGAAGGTAGVRGGTAGVRGGTAGVRGGTAGVRGGTAGVRGGTAGVRGGDAGGDGGTAGVRGGTAGVRGSTAGVRGGTAGVRGGTAGVRGGEAGNSSKVVVQATSDVHYPPFNGNFDPRDKTTSLRVCRSLRQLYIDRYLTANAKYALRNIGGPALLQRSPNPDSLICSSAAKDDQLLKTYPRAAGFADVYHKLVSLSGFMVKNVKNATSRDTTLQFVNKAATGRNNIEVEHQDSCGSCWAQSAIDSFEIALTKAGKSFSPRSVQQLVDCVYPDKSGCTGGSPMDALKYLMTHGSVDATSYPYTGMPGTCRTNPGGDLAALSQDRSKSPFSDGFDLASKSAKLAKDSKDNAKFVYTPCTETAGSCVTSQYMMEADLLTAIQETGPYIVYVDADNWRYYDRKTQVLQPAMCSSEPINGNHLVELMGFTLKNNIPVWIVKNSWGKNFGDDGFIYLPIGYNACGVANFALRATVPGKASVPSTLSKSVSFKMPRITQTRQGNATKSTAKANGTPAKKPVVTKKSLLEHNATFKSKKHRSASRLN